MHHPKKLEEPITTDTYLETLDTWFCLHELLQKMESERGVLILEAVFCEDAVRAALGIGKILTQFVVLWTIRLCCWSILCEK